MLSEGRQTVVEMSSHIVHRNATLFEDPDVFKPERWLGEDGKKLERWLVPFSRGPRSCLGLKYTLTPRTIRLIVTDILKPRLGGVIPGHRICLSKV